MFVQLDTKCLPLAKNSVDLIFTDPPYLKKYLYCYKWLANEAMRVLKPGGFLLVMCGGYYLNKIYSMLDNSGLQYYWELHHFHNGNAPYIWQRNIIAKSKVILAYSKGNTKIKIGGCQSCFLGEGKMKQYHHWGQDVASARYYIDYFSSKDDLVVDPFVGGGTTAIACSLISRRYFCGDIDIKAVKTSIERFDIDKPMKNLVIFDYLVNTNGTYFSSKA